MKRNWKFVGGPKAAKTSLQAAISAVAENFEGESAIFDAETGELYDLTGSPFASIAPFQYQAIIRVLGTTFSSVFHGLPLNKEFLLPLIAQIGNPVFADVKKFAAEYTAALVELDTMSRNKETTEDVPGTPSGGSEPGEE